MIVHHGAQLAAGAVATLLGAVWITVAEHTNPSNLWEASPWIIIAAGASAIIVALWRDKKEVEKERAHDAKKREERYREVVDGLTKALEDLKERGPRK